MSVHRPCWAVDAGLMAFPDAHALQVKAVAARIERRMDREVLLCLQHPAVFTTGRRGNVSHLKVSSAFLDRAGIRLHRIERGGDITFHGPGQLVIYPIFDLKRTGLGVLGFVEALEEAMIRTAADWGIEAHRDPRNRGLWVGNSKMGSIGIAVRRGISFHGIALNVDLSLEPFTWIDPCGLSGVGVTSMHREAVRPTDIEAVKDVLMRHICGIFSLSIQQCSVSELKQMIAIELDPKRQNHPAKPPWLKRRLPTGPVYEQVRGKLSKKHLHTVCQEAHCPNVWECFSRNTATFLILGERCTRNCRFCAVAHGPEAAPDPDPEEPGRVAQTAAEMGLGHIVVTSVTRDDLPDGGAAQFAATIRNIRRKLPGARVEVLIPDFLGDPAALRTVLDARPDVLNHNLETVPRLYDRVRPGADYARSLELLRRASAHGAGVRTKSGLMLGLAETDDEIGAVLQDLRDVGCRLLTLGQYLQPSKAHLPVDRFVTPERFEAWRQQALDLGFEGVASGPFVRSSYRADALLTTASKPETAPL